MARDGQPVAVLPTGDVRAAGLIVIGSVALLLVFAQLFRDVNAG